MTSLIKESIFPPRCRRSNGGYNTNGYKLNKLSTTFPLWSQQLQSLSANKHLLSRLYIRNPFTHSVFNSAIPFAPSGRATSCFPPSLSFFQKLLPPLTEPPALQMAPDVGAWPNLAFMKLVERRKSPNPRRRKKWHERNKTPFND